MGNRIFKAVVSVFKAGDPSVRSGRGSRERDVEEEEW